MILRTTATPDAMPHSVLSTVLDHCTPAIRGKPITSTFPCACTPSLLVTIKGRGGLPLKGTFAIIITQSDHSIEHNTQHPILALASINFSSSRDLGASLPLSPRLYPYYGHLRCKIIQCPRTPPCWMYGPAAGTRINLCVTVLPPASTIWDEKHTASSLVGAGSPGQDTDSNNIYLTFYVIFALALIFFLVRNIYFVPNLKIDFLQKLLFLFNRIVAW